MSAPEPRRLHLVERAVEAMGSLGGPAAAPPPLPPEGPSPEEPSPAAAHAAPEPGPVVRLATLRQAGLAAAPNDARSRVSEEIKVVQHHISRAIRAAEPRSERDRIVLVTSARPGEGKTFTALNIAASFAAADAMPAVLVDADGKQGSISDLLGIGGAFGLRALAADPALPVDGALVPTAIDRLLVLPYGAAPTRGPERPSGTAIVAAIRRLSTALPQHAIILDAPPCLSTSDPSALAAVAGQVVMVVEAERTQKHEVEAALDMVEACPLLQLLLNKARLTVSNTFGAYSGGAYSAG